MDEGHTQKITIKECIIFVGSIGSIKTCTWATGKSPKVPNAHRERPGDNSAVVGVPDKGVRAGEAGTPGREGWMALRGLRQELPAEQLFLMVNSIYGRHVVGWFPTKAKKQHEPIKFKISSEDPSAVLTRCCFCCQVKSPRNLSPRRSLFIYLDPVGPVKLGQEELLAIEISLQTPREHIMRYIFNQSSPASYLPNKNKLVLEHPDTESENTN
ncbi:hypothetical protein R3P38DRAFT_2812876 [Favolaschia claudopus]|uniref:Uncharacterized protein n=1 Tax=Favolaschia claudopus TaxID=2862362 RepID=A0AAV9Z686_9AGAR